MLSAEVLQEARWHVPAADVGEYDVMEHGHSGTCIPCQTLIGTKIRQQELHSVWVRVMRVQQTWQQC